MSRGGRHCPSVRCEEDSSGGSAEGANRVGALISARQVLGSQDCGLLQL